MNDISPIEFGKLINAVDNLEKSVETLSSQVDMLNTQMTSGKGVVVGLAIASAGIGAGISKALEHIFK